MRGVANSRGFLGVRHREPFGWSDPWNAALGSDAYWDRESGINWIYKCKNNIAMSIRIAN